MNKSEQSQLCSLLAKMRYDLMELLVIPNISEDCYKKTEKLIEAINLILPYSYIDGKAK